MEGLRENVEEPDWWTLWATYEDAVDALGRPVARRLDVDFDPIVYASPAGEGLRPWHMWARYAAAGGSAFGVVTIPNPADVTARATDAGAVADAVAEILRLAGMVPRTVPAVPDDPRAILETPTASSDVVADRLLVAATWLPSVRLVAAPGIYVRAAILGNGSAVATWGSERDLPQQLVVV